MIRDLYVPCTLFISHISSSVLTMHALRIIGAVFGCLILRSIDASRVCNQVWSGGNERFLAVGFCESTIDWSNSLSSCRSLHASEYNLIFSNGIAAVSHVQQGSGDFIETDSTGNALPCSPPICNLYFAEKRITGKVSIGIARAANISKSQRVEMGRVNSVNRECASVNQEHNRFWIGSGLLTILCILMQIL